MIEQGPTRDAVVYVPTGDDLATRYIAEGSGIVGIPDGSPLEEIYFEGAVHGQVNMASLADRVAHAYGPVSDGGEDGRPQGRAGRRRDLPPPRGSGGADGARLGGAGRPLARRLRPAARSGRVGVSPRPVLSRCCPRCGTRLTCRPIQS
jgi:hypothetical protein